ncbi:mitochondrial genome maintenance protein MGM101 [Colletotrichum liriopes]|uniref:Mitochondrial genome maintenance protein MGM101 n=1 Tax=Colletotrichum liriopes TaxID=708192 RepID=A0AA37M079_9PEZI|nr:mitochondrial genome maintenance protein MGM101 [Colletotrichum liriopes]
MATPFTLRPLLRMASRQSLTQTASIATTSRHMAAAAAATTTTSRTTPAKSSTTSTYPVNTADVEVKPDGIIYLPEIKYRRILNAAFGPGGWGLVPKGEVVVGDKIVTREYALIAEGRFISQAQGENTYFSLENLPSAVEGCKSNALMRCCKDLGIASDLWDPVFIRQFKKQHADEVWVEHAVTKKKKMIWTRKDVPVGYPFKRTN